MVEFKKKLKVQELSDKCINLLKTAYIHACGLNPNDFDINYLTKECVCDFYKNAEFEPRDFIYDCGSWDKLEKRLI